MSHVLNTPYISQRFMPFLTRAEIVKMNLVSRRAHTAAQLHIRHRVVSSETHSSEYALSEILDVVSEYCETNAEREGIRSCFASTLRMHQQIGAKIELLVPYLTPSARDTLRQAYQDDLRQTGRISVRTTTLLQNTIAEICRSFESLFVVRYTGDEDLGAEFGHRITGMIKYLERLSPEKRLAYLEAVVQSGDQVGVALLLATGEIPAKGRGRSRKSSNIVRCELIKNAVQQGSLENFEMLLGEQELGSSFRDQLICEAAARGNSALVEKLLGMGAPLSQAARESALCAASKGGDLALFLRLNDPEKKLPESIRKRCIELAAFSANKDILQLLLSMGPIRQLEKTFALEEAEKGMRCIARYRKVYGIRNGHREIVKKEARSSAEIERDKNKYLPIFKILDSAKIDHSNDISVKLLRSAKKIFNFR